MANPSPFRQGIMYQPNAISNITWGFTSLEWMPAATWTTTSRPWRSLLLGWAPHERSARPQLKHEMREPKVILFGSSLYRFTNILIASYKSPNQNVCRKTCQTSKSHLRQKAKTSRMDNFTSGPSITGRHFAQKWLWSGYGFFVVVQTRPHFRKKTLQNTNPAQKYRTSDNILCAWHLEIRSTYLNADILNHKCTDSEDIVSGSSQYIVLF